jgi:hypothetical protein
MRCMHACISPKGDSAKVSHSCCLAPPSLSAAWRVMQHPAPRVLKATWAAAGTGIFLCGHATCTQHASAMCRAVCRFADGQLGHGTRVTAYQQPAHSFCDTLASVRERDCMRSFTTVLAATAYLSSRQAHLTLPCSCLLLQSCSLHGKHMICNHLLHTLQKHA